MASSGREPEAVRGYVVLGQVEPGLWYLAGEVDHRPGLAMRRERAQAVRDAVVGADPASGVYAALPRDQWHLVHYD